MLLLNGLLKVLGRTSVLTYVDAGTGSMVLQVLLGMAAGGLLALKLSWNRIKNWARRDRTEKRKTGEGQEHLVEN